MRLQLTPVVETTVKLEDKGFFHAGKGSSPDTDGFVEQDASLMSGIDLQAGGVTLVRDIKNAIRLARLVFESPQVLLGTNPALELAREHGLQEVANDYFVPCDIVNGKRIPDTGSHGTVGAVARDLQGNYAAATSTGGTLNKTAGRIGDTPLIGAGTYAKNNVAAVSSTGYGEYFIREVAAFQVVNRIELLGESVGAATGTVLEKIHQLEGSGGLIAIGPRGEVSMVFNTTGMYRASIDAWGKKTVGVL